MGAFAYFAHIFPSAYCFPTSFLNPLRRGKRRGTLSRDYIKDVYVMLEKLAPYLEPVLQACLAFPVIAAVFTLPFLIVNYRRYGGIAVARVLVVYSFILYELCALLLTVLPLPSREAVEAMAPRPVGWVPFTDLNTGLVKSGFSIDRPETFLAFANWQKFFTSSDFFQIVANIVMQIPLGFYLRYYFRRSWKQTMLIGFLISLFYELTQYTGLWFLYPKAYRFATVDDLLCNTLGCMLGFWLSPLLTWALPSREEIDKLSYAKGQRITLLRRVVAVFVDWVVFGVFSAGGISFLPLLGGGNGNALLLWEAVCFAVCFVFIPWLNKGRTLGHALLKLRVISTDGGKLKLWQLFARYSLLYCIEPLFLYGAVFAVLAVALILLFQSLHLGLRLAFAALCMMALGLCLWFPLYCFKKRGRFPHSFYSRTAVVMEER